MSPNHSILLCLLITSFLSQGTEAANLTANAEDGIFLQKEISVTDFFPRDLSPSKVKFIASLLGAPDLPTWLQLEQETPTDRAFIYGTPDPEVSSEVVLEITAWNKKDYSTERRNMIVNIDKSKGIPRYQAEFMIKNKDIDEFLEDKESRNFVDVLKRVWKPKGGVQVTSVESALDRGGRVPVPPNKEGVYITVGGNSSYKVLEKEYRGCAGLSNQSNQQFDPPYDIDWCKFTLIDKSKAVSPVANATEGVLPGKGFDESTYVAPVYDSSARDFGSEFILILILPLILVIIIAIILAVIMFGFREGRPKRDAETSRPQLYHHDSILRATFRLRQLSHQNGEPAQHSPARSLPRDTSTPYKNSPQPEDELDAPRGAPPPYRLPPQPAINVSSPDGDNKYYPGSAQEPKRERPPPFMSSGDVH